MSQQSSASINASIGSDFSVDMADLDSWLEVKENMDTVFEESIQEETTDEEMESQPKENDLLDDENMFTSNNRKDGNNKLNRFICTFFPPNYDRKWLEPETYFPNPKSKFDLWCGQFELCPTTQKLHVHLYIECNHKNRMRFNVFHRTMRKVFARVQLRLSKRATKKQRQSAINYCVDVQKRLPQTECFLWSHNKHEVAFDPTCVQDKKESKKDKAEMQEEQRQWIESKPRYWTWDQIVHESEESKTLLFSCPGGEKYHKGRHAADPRRTIQNVIILYGAGGTGKTTEALAWGEKDEPIPELRYYRRNLSDGEFWGGGRTSYKGQRVIHYEEFTGQEAFSRLKEVCDIGKQGPPVNVKNGGTILNHETVIFTSNVHPAGWFHRLWDQDPKQWMPFERRITQVRFYPSHRPDGSLNSPDKENPPFFIDQTEDFRKFVGDYGQAKEHAELHWPLKVEPEPQAQVFVPGRSRSEVTEPPIHQYCKTGVDPLMGAFARKLPRPSPMKRS